NGADALSAIGNLFYPDLLLQQVERRRYLALGKQFDSGFECRVFLADDFIEFGRAHSGVLQLFKRSPCLSALVLPRIANQQHPVLGGEPREKLPHLIGACETRFVYEIEMSLLRWRERI